MMKFYNRIPSISTWILHQSALNFCLYYVKLLLPSKCKSKLIPLVYNAMSETHSTVNVKNYQFTYPSIAVWQDFNDLNLLESKKKSGSNFLKSKKSLYFSEKRNSRKAKESRKMKRFATIEEFKSFILRIAFNSMPVASSQKFLLLKEIVLIFIPRCIPRRC